VTTSRQIAMSACQAGCSRPRSPSAAEFCTPALCHAGERDVAACDGSYRPRTRCDAGPISGVLGRVRCSAGPDPVFPSWGDEAASAVLGTGHSALTWGLRAIENSMSSGLAFAARSR
jgi:hypothetical protein